MALVRRDAYAGDEWNCPICDRRIVLRLPPGRAPRVLEAGDEMVLHATTGRRGLPEPEDRAPAEESEVDAWRRWLHDGGLETWLVDLHPER